MVFGGSTFCYNPPEISFGEELPIPLSKKSFRKGVLEFGTPSPPRNLSPRGTMLLIFLRKLGISETWKRSKFGYFSRNLGTEIPIFLQLAPSVLAWLLYTFELGTQQERDVFERVILGKFRFRVCKGIDLTLRAFATSQMREVDAFVRGRGSFCLTFGPGEVSKSMEGVGSLWGEVCI